MECQNQVMENFDSPYIYEKPLAPKKSKNVIGFTALGLAGIGSILGGTAMAGSLQQAPAPQQLSIQDPAGAVQTTAEPVAPILPEPVAPILPEPVSAPDNQIIAIPLESASPRPSKEPTPNQVVLPTTSSTTWGNVSRATYSAGSSGSSEAAYEDYEEEYSDSED